MILTYTFRYMYILCQAFGDIMRIPLIHRMECFKCRVLDIWQFCNECTAGLMWWKWCYISVWNRLEIAAHVSTNLNQINIQCGLGRLIFKLYVYNVTVIRQCFSSSQALTFILVVWVKNIEPNEINVTL